MDARSQAGLGDNGAAGAGACGRSIVIRESQRSASHGPDPAAVLAGFSRR